MRGLIIAAAIVLGPVVVVACVDGLATGPVGDEFGAVFHVNPGIKHGHRCPHGFAEILDTAAEFNPSVDRNNNGKLCSNGHALVDDVVSPIKKKVVK